MLKFKIVHTLDVALCVMLNGLFSIHLLSALFHVESVLQALISVCL